MSGRVGRYVVVWLVLSIASIGAVYSEDTFTSEELDLIQAAKDRGTKGLTDAEILRFLEAFERHEASEAMALPNVFFEQAPPAKTVAPKDPENLRNHPTVQKALRNLEKVGVSPDAVEIRRFDLYLPTGRHVGGYLAGFYLPESTKREFSKAAVSQVRAAGTSRL